MLKWMGDKTLMLIIILTQCLGATPIAAIIAWLQLLRDQWYDLQPTQPETAEPC